MIAWLLPCRLCGRFFCRKWTRLCIWCRWYRQNSDEGERAFAHFGAQDNDVIPRRER